MNESVQKYLIGFFSILMLTINRKRKIELADKVLIIMSGVLGDSILFLDSYHEICSFNNKLGRKTILVCREDMRTFWVNNTKDANVEIISLDIKCGLWPCFSDFRRVISLLNNCVYSETLVIMQHGWADMVAASISSISYKAIMYEKWKKNRSGLVNYIVNQLFDEIEINDDMFIGMVYEKLVRYIANPDYCGKVAKIEFNNEKKIFEPKSYICIAPIAKQYDRNLSDEQIEEIIKYLMSVSSLTILICANSEWFNYFETFRTISPERVLNYAGKTTLDEYISLIKNSKMLIGTDSGSIHIAASVGTPSVVLCGYWGGSFLPYGFKIKSKNDPICVYSDKEYECRNCLFKCGDIGRFGSSINEKCYSRIKSGKNRLCLDDIDMEKVKGAVGQLLRET